MLFLPARRAVHRLRHVELVADDLRAALDPLRERAVVPRCRPSAASPSCSRRRRGAAAPAPRAPRRRASAWKTVFFGRRSRCSSSPSACPARRALRRARRRARGRLDDRAPRRLRRAVGDPARDGELGASRSSASATPTTIRCCASSSRHLDGLLLRERATGDAAHAAVPLAGLGHGAREPRAGRRRASRADAPGAARARRRGCSASRCRAPGDWSRRNAAPPGRLVLRAPQRVLSGRRRHLHGAHGAARARAPTSPSAAQEAACARGLAWMLGMQNDDGGWASFDRDNDKQWLTAGAVRRPQRHDRSEHGRHHRAACSSASATSRASTRRAPGRAARARVPAPRSDHRRVLVRALGRELHLRDLAGAARPRARIGEDLEAPYVRRARALAARAPERRRRLGREHRELRRPVAARHRRLDAEPDGLGAHGAARRRTRPTAPAASSAACATCSTARTPTGRGSRSPGRGRAFRRSSISNYHFYRHYFPLMALAQLARARQIPLAPSA